MNYVPITIVIAVSALVLTLYYHIVRDWIAERRVRTYLNVTGFTVIVLIIIIGWLYKDNIEKIFSLITIPILIILVSWAIYFHFKVKRIHKSIMEIEGRHNEVLVELIDNIKRYSLQTQVSPTKDKALQYFLDNVLKILDDGEYKLCLAEPLKDGTFDFIGARNIRLDRIRAFKNETNWKEKQINQTSLFVKGLKLENQVCRFSTNNKFHKKFKKPYPEYKPSKVHVIIPIKSDLYKSEEDIVEDCLAVLTIGVNDGKLIPRGVENEIYNKLYPHIKSIEGVLLVNKLEQKILT